MAVSCKTLKDAMRGAGTDEAAIIEVLSTHDLNQRLEIRLKYQEIYDDDLLVKLRRELRGDFQDAVIAMFQPTYFFLAHELRAAMRGPGTDEKTIIDILFPRINEELTRMKVSYEEVFNRNIEEDLAGETRGDLKHLFLSQVRGDRDELAEIERGDALRDAREIFEAGEDSIGTEESVFTRILTKRSFLQLKLMFEVYAEVAGKEIEDSIRREMNGPLEDGLLTIVKFVKDRHKYFAENLHNALKGVGTDERTVIRTLITRADFDLAEIAIAYAGLYGERLSQDIASDLQGPLRDLYVAVIGDR